MCLENTKEYVDGNFAGELGEVLIRCNNVLYIRAAVDDTKGGSEEFKSESRAVAMEG